MLPFWRAVFGYAGESPYAIVDPAGRGPAVWFQQMDAPRTDGGKVLRWHGHCGLLGGVTPTIDRHHSVISVLSDRYLLVRLSQSGDPEADVVAALSVRG